MSSPVVYIIGAMRNCKYYNFPAFDAARDMLKAQDFYVISPADMDREYAHFDAMELPEDTDWSQIPDGFDFDDCVTRDIEAVQKCNIIYALKSWKQSSGARAEHALAEWLGKTIMYGGGR